MRYLMLMIVSVLLFCSTAHAAPTVFFKDGTKEVGSAIWTENDKVYLNKSNDVYEYGQDELELDETLKYNRLGAYQGTPSKSDQTGSGKIAGKGRKTKRSTGRPDAARVEAAAQNGDESGGAEVTASFAPLDGSNPGARDTSPEAARFIKQFRAAIASGNLAALSGLVHWQGVDADTRHSVEFALKECMKQPIQDVYIGRVPEGMPLEYKLKGVTYRPNLAPSGFLNIRFVPGQKTGQATITSTGFMVGRSGSKIMIATAAAQ